MATLLRTVLAAALWNRQRKNMPAPVAHVVRAWDGTIGVLKAETSESLELHAACALFKVRGGAAYGYIDDLYRDGEGRARLSTGDWLRRKFRQQFGRDIQSRWFN